MVFGCSFALLWYFFFGVGKLLIARAVTHKCKKIPHAILDSRPGLKHFFGIDVNNVGVLIAHHAKAFFVLVTKNNFVGFATRHTVGSIFFVGHRR